MSYTNKVVENVKNILISFGYDKEQVNSMCFTFDCYFSEYLFGDYNQCEPVETGSQMHYNYQYSITINHMCSKTKTPRYIESTSRYDTETNDLLKVFFDTGRISTYFEPAGKFNKNICLVNSARIRVNTKCYN